MQNPGALRLILYQDDFEVANPLGSGRKKHKILAVYLSLANFPPHYRSTVDQIQLVLLCCESDFKRFGQRATFVWPTCYIWRTNEGSAIIGR